MALSTCVNDIEDLVLNGKHTLAISLDWSGAFDCIKFESAERCMTLKIIPSNIVSWYTNLLSEGESMHRYKSTRIGDSSKKKSPGRVTLPSCLESCNGQLSLKICKRASKGPWLC